MATAVASFRNVSKIYPVYASPAARLAELATLGQRRFHHDFPALTEATFDIQRGETFCIIGENGSGKSTLLQILAGVLAPTSGEVKVTGRVAALLELGAGFHPEFSGRENVHLACAIHGFSRAEAARRFAAIEAFAEIGPFINHPVKTYSSGMLVRLAFAVAIHVEPDILIVDEALAVGDFYFRQRCLRKVNQLRARGATIVFVSHATGDIKAVGDRVLWLDAGRVRQIGAVDEVVAAYVAAMARKDLGHPHPHGALTLRNVDHRSGTGAAEVLGLGVFDETGDAVGWLNPGTRTSIRIQFAARTALASPAAGFELRNHLGVLFAGTSTTAEGTALPPMKPGEVVTIAFEILWPTLYPSHFSFSPYITESGSTADHVANALTLEMAPAGGEVYGYIGVPCRIEMNPEPKEVPVA
jgi:lipopolysaccharide transport system ATP-binding protein